MPVDIGGGVMAETVGDILERGIGDNGPPEPTPFELVKADIDDLYAEAKNWLDGEPIATEGQAEEIGKLRDKLRAAAKRAEEQRKIEAKPFDDGKAEVQARYNPLIQKDRGICDLAIKTCNQALKPWLDKIDAELRAKALAEREEAERIAREARDAARKAAESASIDDREKAEDLLSAAKQQVATMKAAEKARPQVAGATRAIGMKSVWHPELVDPAAAIEHYRKAQPGALKEWMLDQARKDVHVGPKPPSAIPGFKMVEERVPV